LATRRHDLQFGGGLNGSYLLAPVSTGKTTRSVFDDGAADQLFDGSGVSWFFVHRPNDVINDHQQLLAGDLVSVIT
jgi:hypothetical protein